MHGMDVPSSLVMITAVKMSTGRIRFRIGSTFLREKSHISSTSSTLFLLVASRQSGFYLFSRALVQLSQELWLKLYRFFASLLAP